MYSKSNNIEVMMSDEAEESIEVFFHCLKNRYQNHIESIKGSEFFLDCSFSKYTQRIAKIKPFISKYRKIGRNIKKRNIATDLTVLYV